MLDLDELKTLIVAKLDVTDFLDVLGLELADLLDLIGDDILEENLEELQRACR